MLKKIREFDYWKEVRASTSVERLKINAKPLIDEANKRLAKGNPDLIEKEKIRLMDGIISIINKK